MTSAADGATRNGHLARPAAPPRMQPDATGMFTRRQVLVIFSGLMAGLFLAALDQTIVATAIRTIGDDLQGLDLQAWVTTAYLITATISTPLYGKLSDLYGRKPFFMFAIGIFTVGSILCTTATSMYELAAFRAIQGLGAGGLLALTFTIIADIVPPRERARYQGMFVAVFGVASVLGPLIGGALAGTETILGIAGWRWVFLINVPIAVVAMVIVSRVLNLPHTRRDHRIDWPGAVLLAVGLIPLLIVAEQGREWGWGSGGAIACYLVGAFGLLAFVLVERLYGDDALIPLRLFRNNVFSVSSATSVIVGIGMFGGILVIPLYLQIVKGATPTESGLLMLPLVLGIMVSSVLSGVLTSRTGRYKIFPIVGIPLMSGAMLLMHFQVDADTALWQTDLYMAMFGFGLGCCLQTLIVAVQNAVPPQDIGVATGSATFFRSIGGTIGVAVFLSILFSTVGDHIRDAFAAIAPTPAFQAALADPAVRADPANAAILAAIRGGQASGNAAGVLQDSSFLQQIDPRLARPFLVGFASAMELVFLVAACVIGIAFFLVLALKELPLRTQSGLQARQSELNGGLGDGAAADRRLVVAAVALLTLAELIERADGTSARLVRSAAALAPPGASESERARIAARTVLRPLAARALVQAVDPDSARQPSNRTNPTTLPEATT